MRDKIRRLLWTCYLLAFYIVAPITPVIRTVCKFSTPTVGRFLSRVSYLPSYVFLRRRRSFTSGKLCFLQLSDRAYVSRVWCIGLFLLRSFLYQRIHEDSRLLTVLRVAYMPLFGPFRQDHGFDPRGYSVRLKLLAQLVHKWECKTFLWVIGNLHVNQGFISDEYHAFAPFPAKINLKFHVTLRSLIGSFNWFIKSDKSGRQAKTIRNVAGGNFTRGFAAREFPREGIWRLRRRSPAHESRQLRRLRRLLLTR